MKCFIRKIRSFNFLYVIRFSTKWHLEQDHIIHRSPIFSPPSADPRVWLAGLLIILFTVVSLPYPNGSPLDFYYKCMRISTVYFLYLYAICQCQTSDPRELLIGFLFLLPLCPFFLPSRCSQHIAVFSFHKPLAFHNCSLIPTGMWTRFQQHW